MKHKTLAIIFLAASMVLVCVAVFVGLYVWTDAPAEQPDEAAQTQQADDADQAETGDEPASDDGDKDEPSAGKKTDWDGPTVAEQDAPMGPAYFTDAAFLGNEMTTGLWLYNNDGLLPSDTDHWYCSDGLTVLGASPYAAQMPADSFDKVYIGFGINEVNYERQTLEAAFNTVIDQVQASQPDAIIYLMSVTPVSKYCDENRGTKRSAVQSFNEMLRSIARDRQIWYLDVYPELCGEDGFLPSDVTPDGINFSPAHYQKWIDYMRTHYVPDGTPPAPEPTPDPDATPEPEPTSVPLPTASPAPEPAVSAPAEGTDVPAVPEETSAVGG